MELEHAKPAGFGIEASYHIVDDMLFAQVETESHADLSDRDLHLFVVLTEDSIYFDEPPGSNGEQEFFRVMRTYVPDAGGVFLDASYLGAVASFEFSHRLNIEEMDVGKLELLAFIQDVNSMEIFQTVRFINEDQDEEEDNGDNGDNGDDEGDDDDNGDEGDETNIQDGYKNEYIRIYPNPSGGTINIAFDKSLHAGKIVLYNQQGVRIISKNISDAYGFQDYRLNVPHLNAGLYLLNIHTSDGTFVKRIIINPDQ